MSSKPNTPDIQQLRLELAEFKRVGDELNECKRAAARIDNLQDLLNEKQQKIIKLLDGMDVKSDGNMGWQSRITWFLLEFDRQASSK